MERKHARIRKKEMTKDPVVYNTVVSSSLGREICDHYGFKPKIKFYCEVHSKVNSVEELDAADKAATEKIEAIKASLGI